MIKYDYYTQYISVSSLNSEHVGLDKYLSELGDDGWQLVSLIPRLNHDNIIVSYMFVFIRPRQ